MDFTVFFGGIVALLAVLFFRPRKAAAFPAPQNVVQSVPLTSFAVGYRPGEMIAHLVIPDLPVVNKTGPYYVINKDNLINEIDGPRSPRDPASQIDYQLTTATYEIQRYNLKELLPDEEAQNFAMGPDAAAEALSQNLMDRLLIAKEVRAAALVFATANITNNTTLTTTAQWSDYDNSEPISDIETAIGSTEDTTAKATAQLSMTMGNAVWRKLKHHPLIVARYQYTAGGGVTVAQFAELFGIKPANVHIGMSKYNSAKEGQAATLTNIWGRGFLVHYTDPAPTGVRALTLASNFVYSNDRGLKVTIWRNNDPDGDWQRDEMSYQQKIVAADAAYYIHTPIAA